jgi:RNA polymerase sigma factor (sigma-70 family)
MVVGSSRPSFFPLAYMPPRLPTGDIVSGMAEPGRPWTSTVVLLTRAKAGDEHALNEIFQRYIPDLRRWAQGRLPRWARDMADTQDLVQEAVFQTVRRLDTFEHRGEGALRAYLRQAVMNRIRDELRRAGRHPALNGLDDGIPSREPSPLERAIGTQTVERYEAALQRLSEDDRELLIARIELGLTYAEVAQATARPTPAAARMAVSRALLRLAEELGG